MSKQPEQPDHEQVIHLPAFLDGHPEIKNKLVEYLKTVPLEEKQKNVEEYKKFISGELTWGEIRKITKRMQRELARVAYLKFKLKDYAKAELLFKGLAIVDHTNWYYRAALGAVYQKQKKYEEAVEEYDIAVELKEDEISCVVNRGECLMMLKDFEAAREDLKKIMTLKLPPNNPWLIRARALNQRLAILQRKDNDDK
ncbi:MAG: hypothetical protein HQM16_07135 [Deltaproteobacteria bacterium]|nr:hypothetical protein [Deltaproteobacteria bacterium]